MSDADGLKGVISGLARGALPAEAPAEAAQLSLLDRPIHGGRVDLSDASAVQDVAERERKAGRPKGAQNLATRQVKEMALRSGTHPLIAMMRWGSLSPEEMAARLGCSRLEAFDRLLKVWDSTLPYLLGKAAPTDQEGNAVPLIQLNMGGVPLAAGPDALPPWERLNAAETLDNQSLSLDVSRPEGDLSHETVSHG